MRQEKPLNKISTLAIDSQAKISIAIVWDPWANVSVGISSVNMLDSTVITVLLLRVSSSLIVSFSLS